MTLLGLADRPGEAHGLGPVDPALARTLAAAAARNAGTTWCLTVTDRDGHPIAHGCARPGGAGNRDGPALTPEDDHGPPGRDGQTRWRLRTPGPGGRDYTVDVAPLAVTDCDHRDQSHTVRPDLHDRTDAIPDLTPGYRT